MIDYEKSDTVIIESQGTDGVWRPCGQLNLKETTFGELAELAIDRPHLKANFKIGSKLRLISNLEKGSFMGTDWRHLHPTKAFGYGAQAYSKCHGQKTLWGACEILDKG